MERASRKGGGIRGRGHEILSETYELTFEAIAAADPDLITAIFRTLTEVDYQKLSKIAPTVAGSPGVAGSQEDQTSWQDQTRIIGQATGRGNEAEQLVAEVEEAYAEAAKRHPEWDGAEVAFTSLYEGGQLFVYTGGTAATNYLELLGFTVPDEFNAFFDDALSVAALSPERFGGGFGAVRLRPGESGTQLLARLQAELLTHHPAVSSRGLVSAGLPGGP